MRRLALVLGLAVGCGGGGSSNGNPPAQLSTQQLIERCLAADLTDLSTLLDTVQGILDPDSGGPQPEFNLVAGLLTGILPWTLDLDGDQVADLSGTVFLTDVNGAVTLPADIAALLGGATADLNAILALLPDGTDVNLTFDFADLDLVHGASGDGDLAVEVAGGVAADVSGGGTFESGDCSFEFSFDGLGPEILDGNGFGTGSVGFDLGVGTEALDGTIALDGTNVARVTTRRNGGPDEAFLVDLETGVVTPG
jgi:hypothetical protein